MYVDPNAPGANNGTSWHDAHHELQTALTTATADTTICVADGTYSPGFSREDTFQLKNNVAVEGGYAGYGAPDPDERDFVQYATTLDGGDFNYHVVNGSGTDPTAVINGFIITGGNADAVPTDMHGGGMYNYDHSSPTVINCTFRNNRTYSDGAGMYNGYACNPRVRNCIFRDNSAFGSGGGMANYNKSVPTVIDCTFIDNMAGALDGGGMYNNWYSNPVLINCSFRGNETNWTGSGGAMSNTYHSSPTLNHCTFIDNFTFVYGGGVYNYYYCYPVFTNCTFSENSAYEGGGGLYLGGCSDATLTNCTILENYVGLEIGVGIHNYNSNPSITNCILWNNMPEQIHNDSSNPVITYSCIEGGYPGQGNIDADPLLFIDPITDAHCLTRLSPCINRGTETGAPMYDFEGDIRPFMGSVDMGADEFIDSHTLATGSFTISRAMGGMVPFALQAGSDHGEQLFCIFGTMSGTAPGQLLPGGEAVLPINFDTFTDSVIDLLNTSYCMNFMSALDEAGEGEAFLRFRPGIIPLGWLGSKMHFAYAVDSFDMTSNPIEITITR